MPDELLLLPESEPLWEPPFPPLPLPLPPVADEPRVVVMVMRDRVEVLLEVALEVLLPAMMVALVMVVPLAPPSTPPVATGTLSR